MAFDPLSFIIGQQTAKSGGGSGDYSDVHFVTFMSEDGSTELYKRPVADGDDCADPVKRGLISEPTKESTAQYNYTHVGWSATPNGALDENILKAVTADKTVYANFAAVLRYYTITYYDSDGTTVLATRSEAYGSVPSFTPTAPDGYKFSAWTPAPSKVTGDASYTVVWEALPLFETSTWAEIAAVCEAGNAASTYALGDTKKITLTNGNSVTLEIIGFNHDDLADGSGKAPITLMAKNSNINNRQKWDTSYKNKWWTNNVIRTTVQGYLNLFPDDLKSLVKSVTKLTHEKNNTDTTSTTETLWLPSGAEISPNEIGQGQCSDGVQYSRFKVQANRIRTYYGSPVEYLLRSTPAMTNGYSMSVDKTGKRVSAVSGGETGYLMFGFCI